MSDFLEKEFRAATVTLSQDPSVLYRGLVCIDGPWVHIQGAEQGKGRRYRATTDPEWQLHSDLSLNAEQVSEVCWEARTAA